MTQDLTVSPVAALQRAVFDALSGQIAAPVYDYVPESATPPPGIATAPYVALGTGWLTADDGNTCLRWMVGFQVSIWSRYRGSLEANTLAGQVTAVLHHADLEVAGFGTVHTWLESAQTLRDSDPEWRHVPMTLRALMEPERGSE